MIKFKTLKWITCFVLISALYCFVPDFQSEVYAAASNPSTPDLSTSSDLGVSNIDNITNDNTPTFIGTADANSNVAFCIWDNPEHSSYTPYSISSDVNGNWSKTVPLLTDGEYSFFAYDMSAGNTTYPKILPVITIKIDTVAPTLTISDPSLSQTNSSDVSYTYSASGYDGINSVPYYDETITGLPSYTCVVSTPTTVTGSAIFSSLSGEGSASFTLRSGCYYDTAGNVNAAVTSKTFLVDTIAPSAPSIPDLASGSDTGLSVSDNLTKTTTPTLNGTAEANSTVNLYATILGSTTTNLIGTATTSATGVWSITTSLVDGAYLLTATATDTFGNVSTLSGELSIIINSALINAYNVTTNVNAAGYGSVTGAGRYQESDSVTVTATPSSGYFFVNWTEGSSIVSTSLTYTFSLGSSDRTLTANYGAYSTPSSQSASTPIIDTTLPSTLVLGSQGWSAIQEDIMNRIDKSIGNKETISITIQMNGTSLVPKEIFNAIKGNDITVTFIPSDGVSWIINGKNISEDPKYQDIDLAVTLGTKNIPNSILQGVSGTSDYTLQISLVHQGNFGFTATLRLNLNKENHGKIANLYYYNPITEQLELQSLGLIDSEGNIEFDYSHASDYAVVIDNGETIRKLTEQIAVTSTKKVLYIGGTAGNETTLEIEIPELLKNAIAKEATSYGVTYTSINPAVVSVSDTGKVIALANGKTVITTNITVGAEKLSFQTKVTVKEAYIKLIKQSNVLTKGRTFNFKAVGYGISTAKITWTTTKKSVVVINRLTGLATAKSLGIDYVVAKVGTVQIKAKVIVE